MILSSFFLSGCYTQFATTDDSAQDASSEAPVIYVQPDYSPGPIYDPAPHPDHHPQYLPTAAAGSPPSTGNNAQAESPKREIGKTRTADPPAAQPAPDRTSGSKRVTR